MIVLWLCTCTLFGGLFAGATKVFSGGVRVAGPVQSGAESLQYSFLDSEISPGMSMVAGNESILFGLPNAAKLLKISPRSDGTVAQHSLVSLVGPEGSQMGRSIAVKLPNVLFLGAPGSTSVFRAELVQGAFDNMPGTLSPTVHVAVEAAGNESFGTAISVFGDSLAVGIPTSSRVWFDGVITGVGSSGDGCGMSVLFLEEDEVLIGCPERGVGAIVTLGRDGALGGFVSVSGLGSGAKFGYALAPGFVSAPGTRQVFSLQNNNVGDEVEFGAGLLPSSGSVGLSLAVLPDLDGDGSVDVVVGLGGSTAEDGGWVILKQSERELVAKNVDLGVLSGVTTAVGLGDGRVVVGAAGQENVGVWFDGNVVWGDWKPAEGGSSQFGAALARIGEWNFAVFGGGGDDDDDDFLVGRDDDINGRTFQRRRLGDEGDEQSQIAVVAGAPGAGMIAILWFWGTALVDTATIQPGSGSGVADKWGAAVASVETVDDGRLLAVGAPDAESSRGAVDVLWLSEEATIQHRVRLNTPAWAGNGFGSMLAGAGVRRASWSGLRKGTATSVSVVEFFGVDEVDNDLLFIEVDTKERTASVITRSNLEFTRCRRDGNIVGLTSAAGMASAGGLLSSDAVELLQAASRNGDAVAAVMIAGDNGVTICGLTAGMDADAPIATTWRVSASLADLGLSTTSLVAASVTRRNVDGSLILTTADQSGKLTNSILSHPFEAPQPSNISSSHATAGAGGLTTVQIHGHHFPPPQFSSSDPTASLSTPVVALTFADACPRIDCTGGPETKYGVVSCRLPAVPAADYRVSVSAANRIGASRLNHPTASSCPYPWSPSLPLDTVPSSPILRVESLLFRGISPPVGWLSPSGGDIVFIAASGPVLALPEAVDACTKTFGPPMDGVDDSGTWNSSVVDADRGGPSLAPVGPLAFETGRVDGQGARLVQLCSISSDEQGWNASTKIDIGGQTCSGVTPIADDLVSCVSPPGSGVDVPVTLMAGSFALATTTQSGSNAGRRLVTAYVAPEVFRVEPRILLAVAQGLLPNTTVSIPTTTVRIWGRHFGSRASDILQVRLAGMPCASVSRINATYLECVNVDRLGFSKGVSRGVLVDVVGGGTSTVDTSMFEAHGSPVVSAVSPTVVFEGSDLTIFADGIGSSASDVLSVLVGNKPCLSLRFVKYGTVTCKVPAGQGFDLPVRVQTAYGLWSPVSRDALVAYGDVPIVQVHWTDDSAAPRPPPSNFQPLSAIRALPGGEPLQNLSILTPPPSALVSDEAGLPAANGTQCWLAVVSYAAPSSSKRLAASNAAASILGVDSAAIDSNAKSAHLVGVATATSWNGVVQFPSVGVDAPSGARVDLVIRCRGGRGDVFSTSESRTAYLDFLAASWVPQSQQTSSSSISVLPGLPIPFQVGVQAAFVSHNAPHTASILPQMGISCQIAVSSEYVTVPLGQSTSGPDVPLPAGSKGTLAAACDRGASYPLAPPPLQLDVVTLFLKYSSAQTSSSAPPLLTVLPGAPFSANLTLTSNGHPNPQLQIPTVPCRIVATPADRVSLDGATGHQTEDGGLLQVSDLRLRAALGTQAFLVPECVWVDGSVVSAPTWIVQTPTVSVAWTGSYDSWRSKSSVSNVLFNTPVTLSAVVNVAGSASPTDLGVPIRCDLRLRTASSPDVSLGGGEAATSAVVQRSDGAFNVTLLLRGPPGATAALAPECTLQDRTVSGPVQTFRLETLQLSFAFPPPATFLPSSPGLTLPIAPAPQLNVLDSQSTIVPLDGIECTVRALAPLSMLSAASFSAPFNSPPISTSITISPLFVATSTLGEAGTVEFVCTRSQGDTIPIVSWYASAVSLYARFATRPKSNIPSQSPLSPFSVSLTTDPMSTVPASFDNYTLCSLALETDDTLALLQASDSRASGGIVQFRDVVLVGRRGSTYDVAVRCRFGANDLDPLRFTWNVLGCAVGEEPSGSSGYTCSPCESGTYSDGGAMSCTSCPPRGAVCSQGRLQLLPGYFRPAADRDDPIDGETDLFPCPNPDACLVNSTARTYSCATGYEGVLCGVCDRDSGFVPQTTTICAECWPRWASALAVSAIAIAFAGVVVYLALFWKVRRSSSNRVILRITLSYLQALGTLGIYAARGPDAFRSAMSFTEVLSNSVAAISPIRCLIPVTTTASFVATLSLPFVVALAVILLNLGRILIRRLVCPARPHLRNLNRRRTTGGNQVQLPTDVAPLQPEEHISLLAAIQAYWDDGRYLSVSAFVAFISYTPIVTTSLQLLNCTEEVIGDSTYLEMDLTIACGSQQHTGLTVAAGIVLAIIGTGFPIFVSYFLYGSSPSLLEDRAFFRRYAFFYDGFKYKTRMFEAVIMLRKALIVLAGAVATDPIQQSVAGILVSGFFLCLQLSFTPYRNYLHNFLETASLIAVTLTQVLSLFFLRAVQTDSDISMTATENTIAALLLLINFGVLLLLLITGFYASREDGTLARLLSRTKGEAVSTTTSPRKLPPSASAAGAFTMTNPMNK